MKLTNTKLIDSVMYDLIKIGSFFKTLDKNDLWIKTSDENSICLNSDFTNVYVGYTYSYVFFLNKKLELIKINEIKYEPVSL